MITVVFYTYEESFNGHGYSWDNTRHEMETGTADIAEAYSYAIAHGADPMNTIQYIFK